MTVWRGKRFPSSRLGHEWRLLPRSSALIRGSDWISCVYSCGLNGNCGIWKGAFYSQLYRGASLSAGALCIRITRRWLVNQVGSAGRRQEFGSFQMQPECKCGNSWKCAEFVPKPNKSSEEKEKLCSSTGFVLFPNNMNSNNPLTHVVGTLEISVKRTSSAAVEKQLRSVGLHANALRWAAAGFHLQKRVKNFFRDLEQAVWKHFRSFPSSDAERTQKGLNRICGRVSAPHESCSEHSCRLQSSFSFCIIGLLLVSSICPFTTAALWRLHNLLEEMTYSSFPSVGAAGRGRRLAVSPGKHLKSAAFFCPPAAFLGFS